MPKKYTPPYAIILFCVTITNIIFNTYFISLLLVGIVFKIFIESIDKEYNNILFLSIITFLIIENTQGFKVFSLTIISLIIYYFIMPRIKNIFSSKTISGFLYVFSFYIFLYISIEIYSTFDATVAIIFLVNLLIDIIITGILL